MQIQKNSLLTKKPIPLTRSATKSLAELHQLRQEVIQQLEKVVGKNAATEIQTMASNLARQESQQDLDSPASPCSWHISPGPTFVRSDSILTSDDDYVPYDTPAISKYGPISRMPKDNQASYRDPTTISSSLIRRTVSGNNPPNPSWFFNNNFHQSTIPTLMTAPNNGLNADTVLYGSPQLIIHSKDPSKELIAESQRVKIQLKNLERQLNDLKMAAQGVSLPESERLTQELQLIEQGIQEKQKEVCLV